MVSGFRKGLLQLNATAGNKVFMPPWAIRVLTTFGFFI